MQKIDWDIELQIINGIAMEAMEKQEKLLANTGPIYQVDNDFLFDVCGWAVIKFRKRNNSFYRAYKRFYKKLYYNEDPDGLFHDFPAPYRQEYSVMKATCEAVAEYLNKTFNADVYVKSWID